MNSDIALRLGLFLLALSLIGGWEIAAPRRQLRCARNRRWLSNIGLGILDQILLRWCFPILAVTVALVAQQRGWGLFNTLNAPNALVTVLCFLLLDLAIYLQHVVFHYVPPLWRLHRVHHSDLDFDVTTAIRFHPLEIVLSMLIKMTVVLALGAPPLAVLIFEVALNLTAMFNHGNIMLPLKLDRLLRWILVTPDMHRVHHSTNVAETNSNFGFNLPWWDRLFSTYRAQPQKGHEAMTVGLNEYRDEKKLRLLDLLLQPFR